MSVYLKDGSVLLDGGSVAIDTMCCCGGCPCVDPPWFTSFSLHVDISGSAYVAVCNSDCTGFVYEAIDLSGSVDTSSGGDTNFAEDTGWYIGANSSLVQASIELNHCPSSLPLCEAGSCWNLGLAVAVNLCHDFVKPLCAIDRLDCDGNFTSNYCECVELGTFNSLGTLTLEVDLAATSLLGTYSGTVELGQQYPCGPCQPRSDCGDSCSDVGRYPCCDAIFDCPWPESCDSGLDAPSRASASWTLIVT